MNKTTSIISAISGIILMALGFWSILYATDLFVKHQISPVYAWALNLSLIFIGIVLLWFGARTLLRNV